MPPPRGASNRQLTCAWTGRRKRRPPLEPLKRSSIDAGAAYCFGDGQSGGVLAGRKETTRKLYRDAYPAFRRFLADAGVDPAMDSWNRLPPNVLAAFYRWYLDHRRGGMTERTAASYAYAISALLRQLLVDERLPASVSLEKLRLGLREALARGDYVRRKVDPRLDAFLAWVAAQPIPPADTARGTARLEALRARALALALYCSGMRREEVTALEKPPRYWAVPNRARWMCVERRSRAHRLSGLFGIGCHSCVYQRARSG